MSASGTPATWQLPLQWPEERPLRRDAPRTTRVVKVAIVVAIMALTVLDRFGLRIGGDVSLSVGVLALYALCGAMVLGGAAELNVRAALGFIVVAGIAVSSFALNVAFGPPAYVSVSSLALLVAVYAPLCLSLRAGVATSALWRWTVRAYIGFAVVVALAGIAQYFLQFVFNPPWLFDYTSRLPESIQTSSHWATVHEEGDWVKSNGFFMREPSTFSILAAFGLLCELSVDRRKWVMAIFALGLLLSYSGSGLLCLGVALLFPLGRGTLARLVTFGVLGAAVFLIAGDALNLSYTLQRADEFTSPASSGYCRFVLPAASALEQIDSDPWASILGHGPGSILRRGGTCTGFEPALAKAIFEYGVAGLLAFGVLMGGALNRSAAPPRLRAGAAVSWLLLSGLLAGETVLLAYLISAMWPPGTAARAAPP